MQSHRYKGQNILFMSDTHGKHRKAVINGNFDIVIHCGDICIDGNCDEIADFFNWFSDLKIPVKIFVSGNHDLPFELDPDTSKQLIPNNVNWLNGNSLNIGGIEIRAISQLLSENDIAIVKPVDILISHYPPVGILDNHFGLEQVKNYVTILQPKYHVFGHNHAGYGKVKIGNTIYINASVFNSLT